MYMMNKMEEPPQIWKSVVNYANSALEQLQSVSGLAPKQLSALSFKC